MFHAYACFLRLRLSLRPDPPPPLDSKPLVSGFLAWLWVDGGEKRWRWTAVGSPPFPLLSYACCFPEEKEERRGGRRWVRRIPCCRTLVVSPRRRMREEVDGGGFAASLVVVRLLSCLRPPQKQQAYNNKFLPARRKGTPRAILHLHLQTTPTLSTLNSPLSTLLRRPTNATESR